MKCKAVLREKNAEEALYKGDAFVEITPNDGAVILMSAPEFEAEWKFLKHGCILKNKTDNETKLVLKEDGTGKALILTPYGEMEVPVSSVRIEKDGNTYSVFYVIEEHPFHFFLTIEPEREDMNECI